MTRFDNSYARLPDRFFSRTQPAGAPAPQTIAVNTSLAAVLGIDPATLTAEILTGAAMFEGMDPIATVYSGHQFGNWAGQLGDGRAHLMGEIITPDGARFDYQLKGSGRTPYSRGGDGRAWLGPVLREYVVSEAMHALGIPTTRALGAALTGDNIHREGPKPGAVLTRIAESHIRVGSFQHFAQSGDVAALEALYHHVQERHYPDAATPMDFYANVIEHQAKLIAQWMGVGFIHGVMNTDNCHIAGLTIDYGPCAFMDQHIENKTFSSIDRFGRYAYNQQPVMGAWNLAQLGMCLFPLLPKGDETAKMLQNVLDGFYPHFQTAKRQVFLRKLGILGGGTEDDQMIADLSTAMQAAGADFTTTFRHLLADGPIDCNDLDPIDGWKQHYRTRLKDADQSVADAANPALIPRNHQIEMMISEAITGDFTRFTALNHALAAPYMAPVDGKPDFTRPPKSSQEVQATFCGT
ncbi:MAG: protein adenylyltransferase SelO [Halocynthiibacter sp.]